MKLASPWSTSIVDVLPISSDDKLIFKAWIWCDRAMWIGVTASTVAALMVIFR